MKAVLLHIIYGPLWIYKSRTGLITSNVKQKVPIVGLCKKWIIMAQCERTLKQVEAVLLRVVHGVVLDL